MTKAHIFFRNLRSALRRWWWVQIGERQRVIEERDRAKEWADIQFKRAREAEHALWALNADCLPSSIDVLRKVATEITCGDACEHTSYDFSTNMTECPRSERGECPFDDAMQLTDLADALETYKALKEPTP